MVNYKYSKGYTKVNILKSSFYNNYENLWKNKSINNILILYTLYIK